MGNSVSATALQAADNMLASIASPASLPSSDPQWRGLWSFPVALSSLNPADVEEVLQAHVLNLGVPDMRCTWRAGSGPRCADQHQHARALVC